MSRYFTYGDCMNSPGLWRVADACVEWHTDEATARDWIASGKVRGIMTPDGDVLVPISEVARWQGVLGQNRLLPGQHPGGKRSPG